jgi:lipopolysaccharide/colanic/teichoic acid biosynthesis glycosyltransferase
MKRAFDILAASVILCLSSPLFLLSAIAVRLSSKGPVLFEQARWGHNGVLFGCLKLRTMVANAEDWLVNDPALRATYRESGFKLELDQDPRITALGQFLRKTYLDELPQLINVIRGDMSLVGPRPIVEEELERYGANKKEYLSVRPGVFGAWTAQGDQRVDYPDRALVELGYVRDVTILRDCQILLKHIPVLMVGLAQGLRSGFIMVYNRLFAGPLSRRHDKQCDRVI